MNLIEDANRIFNQAINEYNPEAVFLLTSGGNDSIVPLHLFKDHPRVTAAVHIDTGIKVPEVEQHVIKTCADMGLDLKIYRALEHTKADGTPDPQDYEEIVKKFGFPGPSQHRIMYIRLKERQIERLVRDYKRTWRGRVMLVTGVRSQESRRRMGTTQEILERYSKLWVAPIVNWDSDAMNLYRAHYNLPISPVSKALGMSGECLCGAFASKGELDRITQYYPEIGEKIKRLQVESGCPWGWEDKPSAKMIELNHSDDMPLCTSCITKGRSS